MIDAKFALERLLAEKPEMEVVDFKTSATAYDFEKIGKYFSALSNEADFEELLLDKISDALDEKQKKDKIKNILQSMRRANIINNFGKIWRLSKPD
jgi:hypothetical protein